MEPDVPMEESPTGCLLCCQSLHSPLIPAAERENQPSKMVQIFDIFCDYMELDVDDCIQDQFRGRLFPFCFSCSLKVYKLEKYHQEKMRILLSLSQVVASMSTLVLESHSEDQRDLSVRSGSPGAGNLADQIVTLRKKVIEKYSPRLVLNDIKPAECSTPSETQVLMFNDQILWICPSNLSSELQGPSSALEREAIADDENDFADVSMDVDYTINGGDNDDECEWGYWGHVDQESTSGQVNDTLDLNTQPQTGSQVLSGRKRRLPVSHTQVGVNTFSIADYVYTFENNEFKCCECSHTHSLQKNMNRHILQSHANSFPAIPNKKLEDIKIGENKYVLGKKFFFEKDTANNFRCCCCKYTTSLWSVMYIHIFKMHYNRNKSPKQRFVPDRPVGKTTKIDESEYEYLGVKYRVLPHGSHRCEMCGTLSSSPSNMRVHIRRHIDFLPEVPDKSLEDYEIATDLFCLTRKYLFEKTGDSYTCAHAECYQIRSTWEDMYTHIRRDHWEMETKKKCKKRIRSEVESVNEEGVSSKIGIKQADQDTCTKTNNFTQDLLQLADLEVSPGHYEYKGFEFRFNDQMFYCGSCAFITGLRGSLVKHINSKHINNWEGFVETRPNEFLYLEQYAVTKEPDGRFRCQMDGCELVPSFSLLGHVKTHMFQNHCEVPMHNSQVCPGDGATLQKKLEQLTLQLSKYETGPGQYRYRGTDFKLIEDQLQCGSCPYRWRGDLATMFGHISAKHVDPSQKQRKTTERMKVVEVRPNEFLIDGQFPASRHPDGRYKCEVGDCNAIRNKRSALCQHVRLHHSAYEEGSVNCDVCGKACKNRAFLHIHMVRYHGEGKRQKCPACPEYFYTATALKTHVKNVHNGTTPEKMKVIKVGPNEFLIDGQFPASRLPNGRYKCGVEGCKSTCNKTSALCQHMRLHHKPDEEGLVNCDVCGKACKNRLMLKVHMSRSHGEGKIQKCPECSEFFSSTDAFKTHCKNAHGGPTLDRMKVVQVGPDEFLIDGQFPAFRLADGRYKCGVGDCESIRNKTCSLCEHMKYNHKAQEDGSVICDVCGKPFKSLFILQNHMKTIHKEGKRQKCPACPKYFYAPAALKTHVTNTHNGTTPDRMKVVEVGPNEFLIDGQFPASRHPDGHYKCDVGDCNAIRNKRSALCLHVRLHHTAYEEGSVNCDVCGKACKNRAVLHIHMVRYHGEGKRQKCPACPKVFYAAAPLKTHITNVHNGTTPERMKAIKIGPNKFLIDGQFPASRLPNGSYKCGVGDCNAIRNRRCSLCEHVRLNHKAYEEGSVRCDVCRNSCKNRALLKIHMSRIHAEGKRQKCSMCSKYFFASAALKTHVANIHKGLVPTNSHSSPVARGQSQISQPRTSGRTRKPMTDSVPVTYVFEEIKEESEEIKEEPQEIEDEETF